MIDLYDNTTKITEEFRKNGYKVGEIWECKFD